jgi:hypothetical protein
MRPPKGTDLFQFYESFFFPCIMQKRDIVTLCTTRLTIGFLMNDTRQKTSLKHEFVMHAPNLGSNFSDWLSLKATRPENVWHQRDEKNPVSSYKY